VDQAIVNQCRAIYGGEKFIQKLPTKGQNSDEILKQFQKYQHLSKVNWKQGRASGKILLE